MKQIIKIVFSIIAAFIGAGFASGQEINIFFYSYGFKGILGIIICSLLMSYIIYKVLKIIKINNINNYKDFVNLLFKKNNKKKYFNFNYIINTVINLFLLISFFIMIAGFGAYFSQEIKINNYIGSGILAILCCITLLKNSSEVIKINSLLVPVLILFILIIGIKNLKTIDLKNTIKILELNNKNGWLISCILYGSYNSIFLIPVIISLKKYIKNKNSILICAILIGIIIICMEIVIFLLLTKINTNINTLEMPVIYVIGNYFKRFKLIYALVILVSIYTTAISIGMSILENIEKNKNRYKLFTVIICISGFAVSGLGFSNLVEYIYPIFGCLGLFQILKIATE